MTIDVKHKGTYSNFHLRSSQLCNITFDAEEKLLRKHLLLITQEKEIETNLTSKRQIYKHLKWEFDFENTFSEIFADFTFWTEYVKKEL